MSDLLLYRPARRPRKSTRVPSENHGARYQAEHPAPDPGPAIPAPWEPGPVPTRRVFRALVAVAVMAGVALAFGPAHVKASAGIMLALSLLGMMVSDVRAGLLVVLALVSVGCAHRAAPGTDVVRVQPQAVSCLPVGVCTDIHAVEWCSDQGGVRRSGVIEVERGFGGWQKLQCVAQCENGALYSAECRDRADWRVAEVR